MSFEPASPINVIVCNQCQGKARLPDGKDCPACDGRGVYATADGQTIAFNLPDFIDLKTRQRLTRLFITKRLVLISVALILCLTLLTLV